MRPFPEAPGGQGASAKGRVDADREGTDERLRGTWPALGCAETPRTGAAAAARPGGPGRGCGRPRADGRGEAAGLEQQELLALPAGNGRHELSGPVAPGGGRGDADAPD